MYNLCAFYTESNCCLGNMSMVRTSALRSDKSDDPDDFWVSKLGGYRTISAHQSPPPVSLLVSCLFALLTFC